MSTTYSFLPSPDGAGEVGPLVARSYMSPTYLGSAALFAKKAFEIENRPEVLARGMGVVERPEHQACASAAILMSALSVEAFINELFADCAATGANNLFGLKETQANTLGQVWQKRARKRSWNGSTKRSRLQRRSKTQRPPQHLTEVVDLEPLGAVEKYNAALKLLFGDGLDHKDDIVKAMRTLVELRNSLAHYNLAYRQLDSAGEPIERLGLDQDLGARLPGLGPMTASDGALIADQVLVHAVAEWSVQTALGFIVHFGAALGVEPQFGSLWPIKALHETR
ncbi:hypothetical protein [Burkholderia gladioli]|uniref:hypothetical protein n=1 Tax=Burkholderia gladioli TaxID=28095 RepID=UPI00163E499A|nr:hypothetical protein [Burkholderia gladioli]